MKIAYGRGALNDAIMSLLEYDHWSCCLKCIGYVSASIYNYTIRKKIFIYNLCFMYPLFVVFIIPFIIESYSVCYYCYYHKLENVLLV
jgi:hypothetical protein